MGEPIDLNAVYTGDSANYHIFQLVGENDFVGSIYIKKKSDYGIPEAIEVNFITPTSDNTMWVKGINSLIKNAREGSKAEHKLKKILNERK